MTKCKIQTKRVSQETITAGVDGLLCLYSEQAQRGQNDTQQPK